jgi:hypothetical protein
MLETTKTEGAGSVRQISCLRSCDCGIADRLIRQDVDYRAADAKIYVVRQQGSGEKYDCGAAQLKSDWPTRNHISDYDAASPVSWRPSR